MKFVYSSLSKTGLRRNTNEDYLGVFELEGGLLVVVCDGLGGNKAGEVASRLTVESIYKSFTGSDEHDYLARIKNSIANANKHINQVSSANNDFKGMATTVEVLYIKDYVAYWGHVGDSRIYYMHNEKLKQISKDHSLVQKLVDEGYLTLKEAENHPNRNIIIRALGDSNNIDVDLSKLKFNSGDNTIFFVCTDGVTTVINDIELEGLLLYKDPEKTTLKISRIIEERGAPDNYSFVIITKFK
jgi:PPM family protein phosphatase